LAGFAQNYFQGSEYQLLSKRDGLCNNSVTDIEQDPYGILWVSTDAGISRYDGMTFYSRTLADKEPVALANLMNTPDGLIWSMAKFRPRICCFNRQTGYFADVRFTKDDIQTEIINIRVVGDRLMAVTPHALYQLHARITDDGVEVTPQKLLDTDDPFVNIYGQGDTVYMSTAGMQLVLYTLPTGRTVRIQPDSLLIRDPLHVRHSYLGDQHLWLCSDREGLILYALPTGKARRIPITEPENDVREARVFDMAQVSDSVYIVSTKSSILMLTFDGPELTETTYRITDITPNRAAYGGLLNERINCIYYDRSSRTLWVGTQGGGLMKLRLWSDDVFHIPAQHEMGHINQLGQDAQGFVWAASETGLFRSDTRQISPTMHFSRWSRQPEPGYHCLYRDSEANLWVGNEAGELTWMNTHTGQEVRYQPEAGLGGIRRVCLTATNVVWLLAEEGVAVYDPRSRQLLASKRFADWGFEVNCMAEDSDGNLWLGTTRGLRLCTLTADSLALEGGYEQELGMNAGYVRSLYINRYNTLLAAYTNKIITIDDKNKRVTGCLLVNQELLDGHVQCMVDDRGGNTWMGSNTGISVYNNRTGQVYHYDASSNYFDAAYLSDGELLWANATGLLYFAPRKVKMEVNSRQLRFSSFEVNNVKLEIGREVNGQVIIDRPAYLVERLDLDADNNNVVVSFTNMKYTRNPERVFYRLLPADKEWHTAWDGRVKLTGLRPGQYTLEVRPPSPFDSEAETLSLPIHVRRPWALTVWAFAAYFLIIVGCGLGIHYYLQRKAARKTQRQAETEDLVEALDEEKGKREESERSHRVRDHIRYTLAQEMRSPLSMAILPLREMLQDATLPSDARHKTQLAYHNTVYLQDICNQILNIYQQEAAIGQLDVAAYTVSSLADDAARTSRELLNVSDVRLDYNKAQRLDEEVWVDRHKVSFVLSNILSNAYRRISYAGTVRLQAEITTFEGRHCCLFRCTDETGNAQLPSYEVRLSADDYSVLEGQLHPEIGLDIMRAIALAHDGDILISHELGSGTQVRFFIPLGRDHFEGRTDVRYVEPEVIMPDEDEVTMEIEKEERCELTLDAPVLAPREVTPETKFTVLVVEDNSDIRLYLKVLLSSRYNVLLAENGQEGIHVARKEQPDLILTDIMMPVMDGLECCRILKEDLKTCHIPVIMLTALTSDDDVMRGLETGADDYILKPFNPDILRSKIKNLVQSRVDLKRIYTRLLMTALPGQPEAEGGEAADAPAKMERTGLEDPFIAHILEEVRDNLQNPDFSVKRLAERMNMSQPTLYRRVKQLTNFTIIELIRGVRLKEAAELLRTRKYTVQEVAERVGYNDVPTFRKHFIDLYGTTPSTFVQKEN
jgi:CheY-like chemotaxis protein/ligand-binding sensor domain-containing protein/AraC-like DNA-binding protein/signal transduction histidine kinase